MILKSTIKELLKNSTKKYYDDVISGILMSKIIPDILSQHCKNNIENVQILHLKRDYKRYHGRLINKNSKEIIGDIDIECCDNINEKGEDELCLFIDIYNEKGLLINSYSEHLTNYFENPLKQLDLIDINF